MYGPGRFKRKLLPVGGMPLTYGVAEHPMDGLVKLGLQL